MTATSLHTLVGPAAVLGEMVFLGQNILLPQAEGGRPRFAAVIYATRGAGSITPAVALLIKLTFNKPMLQLLRPRHWLWLRLVKPHLHRLQTTLLRDEISGQPQSLAAVTTQIACLVRHQPHLLTEGGALLLPFPPLLSAAAQVHLPAADAPVLVPE